MEILCSVKKFQKPPLDGVYYLYSKYNKRNYKIYHYHMDKTWQYAVHHSLPPFRSVKSHVQRLKTMYAV